MTPVATIAEVPPLDSIPRDLEGPVFREPWEAQAFALVVQLHRRGVFTWTEWADALSGEIAAVKRRGEADTGIDYYRHWLAALEHLLEHKGIAGEARLRQRREELLANWPSGHDHVARRDPVAIA
ncbi:MAG: nitrile hydratase accessory protein [Panacagrimonas sp.]